MNPLQNFIEDKISINKKSPFIICKQKEITYEQFENEVNNISFYLQTLGIKEGENIAVVSENISDFIFIIFSLWKLKAVPVPINIKLFPEEIEKQIKFADCKFVLISKETKIKINHPHIIYFPLEGTFSEGILNKNYSKNDTALIMFTSGSSGKSKAVQLTYNNLVESAVTGNQILDQNENDRWLGSLPFYHIGGFSIIVRAFLYGASIIIPGSLKSADIVSALKNYKPTLASFVSVQLKKIIENNIKPGNKLKNILIGGGFTSEELSLAAVKNGWKITKVYGSTETASFVSAIKTDEILVKPASSGKALTPNKIQIINDKNETVPANISGEIIIKSPSVMKGYYKNHVENSRKLQEGFYYTGDIGYLDDEGYLFVEARRNDLIVSGGENIIPGEVESAILSHPNIIDAFVFGIESDEWGQEVSAAAVLKKQKEITLNELKEFLNQKIAGFKIPKKVFLLDEIPKTSMGKVQKEKLFELIFGKNS